MIIKNRRTWRVVLLIFAVYAILFIVRILPAYLFTIENPEAAKVFPLTIARLAVFYYLAVLITPLVLWLGYLLPLTKKYFWRNLFIHLLLATPVGAIHTFLYGLLMGVLNINPDNRFRSQFFSLVALINNGFGLIVGYAAIIAIQQAYLYFRESQERAFRLQEAELQMLKMQLHPHFFFNTLNAISALIYRSPKDADQMITQLGDLFRAALRKDKTHEIRLKEELEFLDALLQIHRTLMGKRLTVSWKIEPETFDALVPNLILQPLVENAIKHGIAPLEEGGLIEICAEKKNEHLVLRVRDNGIGLPEEKTKETGGIGLENTRARLENLYDGFQRFEIKDAPGGGVIVTIEMPFREQLDKAEISFNRNKQLTNKN